MRQRVCRLLLLCGLMLGNPAADAAASALPEAGMLLVARESLLDARFQQTVVLLVQHGPGGTAGLVLNRPSRLPLQEAVPQFPGDRQVTLSYGGPVASRAFLVLVQTTELPPDPAQRVHGQLYLTGVTQLVAWLGKRADDGARYRVFSGYAGWAPGQLEKELARDDWQLLPADTAQTFAEDPAGLWPALALGGTKHAP